MAGAALGAGPGVLALQGLWGLALLLCLALSRAAGRARFAVGVVALGAAVLSAALLLWPREDGRPVTGPADEIVDTFFIGRFLLLAVMSLVLLGCLFLLLIYHLLEPVRAQPLPSSWQQPGAAVPAQRKSRFQDDKPGRGKGRLFWR